MPLARVAGRRRDLSMGARHSVRRQGAAAKRKMAGKLSRGPHGFNVMRIAAWYHAKLNEKPVEKIMVAS